MTVPGALSVAFVMAVAAAETVALMASDVLQLPRHASSTLSRPSKALGKHTSEPNMAYDMFMTAVVANMTRGLV
jgi:hypothetical protein